VRVILKGYDREWRIDTPDAHLVGDWLKSVFDSFGVPAAQHYAPVQFTIEVSA